MLAVLGGVDALVFTGGVGENCAPLREMVCEQFAFLGLKLDAAKNAQPTLGPRYRGPGFGSAGAGHPRAGRMGNRSRMSPPGRLARYSPASLTAFTSCATPRRSLGSRKQNRAPGPFASAHISPP